MSHYMRKESFSSQAVLGVNQEELWDREYNSFQVIPSSTRPMPSKALLLFSEILDFGSLRTVLDVGCGNGRNSVYVAKKGCDVHAIDFSEGALNQFKRATIEEDVKDRITIYSERIDKSFPFKNNSFDLTLDSYVFCHFLDDETKENYRKELKRVTKPGGFIYSSVFSFEDEYYKKIINDGYREGDIVTDPNNGISKYLYTELSIKEFFSSDFEIAYFVKFEFKDIVLGQKYGRSILALILRNPL